MKIDVLDKGYVILADHMGNDLSIVRSARVSHNADWRAGDNERNDTKLINYLWKNKHTTPFESVTFTFEIKAPIFVFRQWHRHRTWSYNEVSARYTEVADEFYIPNTGEIGFQSESNKQARIVNHITMGMKEKFQASIINYSDALAGAYQTYRALLDEGWPRELARMVLPLSTYSRMFATVNLCNLFKFLALRDDSHAQYEIRVYAQAMKELIRPIVPVALEAFDLSMETVE